MKCRRADDWSSSLAAVIARYDEITSTPVDFEGRYGPDKPPPFGFVRVGYRLGNDGRGQATLASSFAPSCWFYRDGMRVLRHDMRQATKDLRVRNPSDKVTAISHTKLSRQCAVLLFADIPGFDAYFSPWQSSAQ